MSYLRSIMRCNQPLDALRKRKPKPTAAHLAKKKERKRLKYINQYSVDYTGEPPLHTWMDSRRLKAVTKAFQEHRNTNRFTRNVDEKDKKEIEKGSLNITDYYVKTLKVIEFY